jgi:hypothetical protein
VIHNLKAYPSANKSVPAIGAVSCSARFICRQSSAEQSRCFVNSSTTSQLPGLPAIAPSNGKVQVLVAIGGRYGLPANLQVAGMSRKKNGCRKKE